MIKLNSLKKTHLEKNDIIYNVKGFSNINYYSMVDSNADNSIG